jgi:hypothetical protein
MSSTEIIVLSTAAELRPAPLFTPTPKAAKRVLEFFTTQINNDHTRKAYLNATRRFAQWYEARGLGELAAVEPLHVATFIKELAHAVRGPKYVVKKGKTPVLASDESARPARCHRHALADRPARSRPHRSHGV